MLKDKKKYEKEVVLLFLETIKNYQQKMIEKKISYKEPELFLIKELDTCYTSELRIDFYFENDLLGVIEFFIFYDGKPKASLIEYKKWFNNEIEYILKKNK
jgi:hypothetical protein